MNAKIKKTLIDQGRLNSNFFKQLVAAVIHNNKTGSNNTVLIEYVLNDIFSIFNDSRCDKVVYYY